MANIVIADNTYELEPTTSQPVDFYAINGKLVDDDPGGKVIGYVTLEDDSVVEVHKKFNILLIIIPVFLVLLVIAGVVAFIFLQPKDATNLDGSFIKHGSDKNVIEYNGIMETDGSTLYVNFTNGEYPAYIEVIGDGINASTYPVEPGQYVDSIPVQITSDKPIVPAKIKVTTDTSEQVFDVIVENPTVSKFNEPSSDYTNGFLKEEIYGGPETK